MALSSHQSARMKNDEWLTPPEILAALGSFDLDPCAPVNRPWATAARHYTVADNGLAMPWHGRVWCNPPFGREAVKWLRRMRDHGNGIALIPARTETAMFYETIWGAADGVLFIKGRPHFHYVDGRRAAFNSGAPIALVAYGRENLNALCDSGLGFVVVGHNTADDLKPAEMVMLTAAEYRELVADAATLKRRIAELELALAATQAPNCDRHASRTNPLPCPHCMADWIVSATNAYARKDWEALRATLYRNVQAQRKHGGRSR